jgi:hypothetical protein
MSELRDVRNVISADETGNSTKIILGSSAVFTGNWEDVTKYTTVAVAVFGSNITDGTLYIESSQDGGTVVNSVPYPILDATFQLPKVWNVVEQYIRIRYVNGTTAQTTFFQLQTKYSNGQELGLLQLAGDEINSNTDVQVTKSVLTGQQPLGSYKNDPANGVAIRSVANLGVGASFTSDWIDSHGYNVIETFIESDVISAVGGVVFEFTDDLSAPVARFTEVFSFGADELSEGFLNIFLNPKMVGFRVVYTNGAGAQSDFLIQTDLKTNGSLVAQLDATLTGKEDVANVRAVHTGPDPSGNFVNERVGGVAFTTTDNLTAGSSYVSPTVDLRNYQQVQTHVLSSHEGTIDIEFYSDAGLTDLVRLLSLPYLPSDSFEMYSAPAFSNYAVYKFTNDAGVTTTDLLFETKLLTGALSGQVMGLSAPIDSKMVANLGRTVLVGQDVSDNFRNVPVDVEGHLLANIASPLTAFGDLRVAELTPQVQLTFPYNINTDLIDITEANGGTATEADSMCVLQTSTDAAGSSEISSRNVVKYRSGLGSLVRFTGLFTTGVANSDQIIGVGDDDDGFFFGFNGVSFGIMARRDGVDAWVSQDSWNIDVMDGSGGGSNPSSMLIDQEKLNVFQIGYQWLGAGLIEYCVEDDVTGRFTPVHRIKYANKNIIPSVFNPSFPLHAHIVNTGNTTNITMKTASMAGFSEGKSIMTGPINAFEIDKSVATGSEVYMYTLRNKSTYVGKNNRISSFIKSFSVGNDGNRLATFRMYENATLAATSYSDINGANSTMEADTAGSMTASTGKLVWTGIGTKDGGETVNVVDLELAMRPGSTYTIVCESADTQNRSIATIWQEDF